MWWGQGADPGEEPPPPPPPIEEGNLKDQFQQQRDQIEELKELLKKDEEKQVSREKEVEKYASRLSDIKSRSKAAKRKATSTPKQEAQEQETETPKMEETFEEASTPRKSSSVKKTQGNLVLLRKKLEENRVKYELRGKELSENKKGIEEMVQHLKTQLDERDVQIKELQKVVEASQSPVTSSEASEDVLEAFDETQDVHAQVTHRDNKIIELKKKIVDLETKVLDLQENFREKDSVIAARTKAITLMSEDFSRRNKTAVDNLEETREEMRKMQNTFVEKEVSLNNEMEELRKEIAAKNLRLHQLEENNKELHSVQFDLSTRNAELQEKVVRMQELTLQLQKQVAEQEEKLQHNEEAEKLKSQLGDAQKQMAKMKAQHKTKMKNLNKQLDALKKMSDANEEILKLQNKIAELEEDKVSESHWQTRVNELEERVTQQSQDLDSHVHMISLLETEKLDHLKAIQEEKEKVDSLEEELEKLKTNLSEFENQKLSLELKTVDLEEQVDLLNKDKKELQDEIKTLSDSNITAEKVEFEENSRKQDMVESVEVLKTEEKHTSLEGELTIDNEKLVQLGAELENSKKVIEEQKAIILELNTKIDERDEELELQREMITKLELLNSEDKEEKIMDIVRDLNEMASDLEEWKRRCNEVEQRLQDLGVEKDELEDRFKDVKTENNMLRQQLHEQKEISVDLSSKLQEQSKAIINRDERINSLQSMIELNGQTLEAREMTLKDVHEKLNIVEKQFEDRLSGLQQVLANKDSEIQDMVGALTEQGDILKKKDNQILELIDTLNKHKQEVLSLKQHTNDVATHFQAELAQLSAAISEKDQLNRQLIQECQNYKEKINELNTEISNRIQNAREIESTAMKELENKLEILETNLKCRDDELRMKKTELESAQDEIIEKSDRLKEIEAKVAELTEKNKKFIANLKAKTVALKGQEQKVQQQETLLQTKENMLVELTSKNESLLAQLNDVSSSTSQEVQHLIERVTVLTNELKLEHTRTELISDELSKATEKIITYESELKYAGIKLQAKASLEEEHNMLIARLADLENVLRVKEEELHRLTDEKLRLNNQEKEKESMLREEAQKQTMSEEKIIALEYEFAALNNELIKLRTEKSSMLAQLSSSYYSIINENSDNILQFDEGLELLFDILERNKQAVSASEAKVQEREAVIEFTEQELSKSKERIQHLEESLAFVEERRLSLENKAETLNLRLQESDRMKEEVFETEGMLEQRLKMLIASEESMKKKVSLLGAENEELSQKVAELMAQYSEARKELVNAECILKDLQKETERLSPFEYSYGEATEKIEHLESEMKRMISEREHRLNEKVQKLQHQTESLESDLRNMNMELEKVELEKRNLLEKYEKLNDEKLNLEDEIEGLNEQIASYKSANENLREKVTSAEVKKELEERIQYLEAELQNKIVIQEEKEVQLNELREKLQVLENDHKAGVLTIESLTYSKEELNERMKQLENNLEDRIRMFETYSEEKEEALANLQEKIHTLEHEQECRTLNFNTKEMEEEISHLNAELESLRSILVQKDNEIKNYQARMLQLQFDTAPQSLKAPDQTSRLEEINSKLQKLLEEKEAQISDIHSVLSASSFETENLRTKITESEYKLEDLEKEVERLREENLNKDNYIQQIKVQSDVQHEMLLMRSQYEEQLTVLQQQKTEVYEELLRLKARQEVSEIVHAAEDHVHRMTAVASSQTDTNVKSVMFQEDVPERVVSFELAGVMSGLENKIKELEEELLVIRNERDDALIRLSQVSMQLPHPIENMPSAEIDDIILMIREENAEVPQAVEKIDSETRLGDNIDNEMRDPESLVVSNTIVPLEQQGWDTSEEEGWGWGSNEAKLEEEHIQKQQHSLLYSESAEVLNKRISDFEAQIKDLEIEKEKLSEELHASQVRSGKMLKKLKDLKSKNDSLMKENLELAKKKADKDFGDLDLAIEEELKIQIDTLEKEVKELKNEKETACLEKDGLMKRIDVLTNANERLVEGKKQQDIDIDIWKQKNKELTNQLQSLEWRLGELEATTQGNKEETNSFFSWDKQGITSVSGDFSEVDLHGNKTQEQNIPQVAEFENLQILLEQERDFRTTAEMHLQELQQRLLVVNTEIELLANENTDLKNQVERLQSQSVLFDQDNYNLQSAYSALHEEYQNLQKRANETVLSDDKHKETLDEYVQKINLFSNENKRLEEQCSNIQKELEDMIDLKTHYMNLQSEYNNIKEHVTVLEQSLAFTDEQKLRFEQEVIQLKSLCDKEAASSTTDILSEQYTKISELEKEVRSKMEEVEMMRQVNENLKLEHAEAEQEWNSKMERLRKELEFNAENLLKQRDLHSMLQKEHEELRDHMNKVIANQVQEVVSTKQQEIETLKTSWADSHRQEEFDKIELIKHKLDESLEILNIRENDIKQLTNRLSEKDLEYNESLSLKHSDIENLRIQLLDTERKMSELLGQKDKDIQNLKIQLEERDLKITELKQLLAEEGNQLIELRKIVEDYEAQMTRPRGESEVSNSQSYQDTVSTSATENILIDETDEGSQSDSQKELDLALYMLHQRDVRCDELTLELMQLLEERDTLQLRLSNALRLNEELRTTSRTSTSSSPVKIVMSEDAEKAFLSSSREESPQHLTATVAAPSTAVTPKEMEEDLQSLANKLSELRSVGYHRDVTLQDEREQRHSEQVRLLHQRGSGIVVDANYTLSRDVQSPSTVLLNWIWGRSTPRVMHV